MVQIGWKAGPEQFPSDIVQKSGCFSSNPQDHIAFAQYVEMGFDCLIFRVSGDQKAFLENYARDVMPKFAL